MQKLVKGATKPKATAPKAKYIEPILATTFEAGRDFDAVMDNLAKVIARGGAWPSIYKALIVVHIMIREGADEVTLKYLARHPHMLEIADTVHRAPAMGRYARYLTVRGQQFREIKVDFIRYKSRQGFSRLHSLPVQKGLMRECSSVLVQLDALMKCQLQEQDIVNDDVLLMAFRLLVHDVLSLFQVLNEGVINLLEHFFELSKPDAEQALDIYRGFRRLTSKVIAYLHAAKDLEFKTRVHVPNIKHAPTSLVSSLEMYLNDPDFDTNRRQYLAEKQAHEVKRTKSQQSRSSSFGHAAPAAATKDAPPPTASNPAAASASQAPLQQQQQPPPPPQTLQLQGQPPAPAQPQVLPQSTLQQTLAPGSIQMVSPELSTNSNPFWQSQQDAAQIQARDGQAQLQMQQIQQLHLQQLEQQERIRQQIQQLEQQNQQHAQHAQHAQQAQQYQPAPQQPTIQQVPYMEPAHTGYDPGFDFGLGPQQPPQQPQQQQPMLQQAPLQPQLTQPQQLQPQYTQPQQLQPQYTQPLQAQTPQPVQAQATGGAAYTNPFQHTSPGSTNPFKTPQQTQFNQFDQFDQIGNQIGAQQSLIDFGQPQQPYQPTGTNPFRV